MVVTGGYENVSTGTTRNLKDGGWRSCCRRWALAWVMFSSDFHSVHIISIISEPLKECLSGCRMIWARGTFQKLTSTKLMTEESQRACGLTTTDH